MIDASFARALAAIPKTETHLHIEGALPYRLLVDLDPGRFPQAPFFREKGYRYPTFVEFENLLISHAVAWFNSVERYHQACRVIFGDLAKQNVKYLETSVHLAMIEIIGIDGDELIHAIKSAAPEGLEVKVIGGLLRNGYTEGMKPIIDNLHRWDAIDGIDMHGQEWLTLEDWAAPVWRRCKDAGKIVKAHAGEFGGPEIVRQVIDSLGVERVQHGVRSIEDPSLVKRLADEGIVLDVCPISNEKLGVVESIEVHPIKELVRAGVTCTVNTDDPLCFANTVTDEFLALAGPLGFTPSELAEVAKNGFRTARMDKARKTAFMDEIDAILREPMQ